jgi:hypothetical protein
MYKRAWYELYKILLILRGLDVHEIDVSLLLLLMGKLTLAEAAKEPTNESQKRPQADINP